MSENIKPIIVNTSKNTATTFTGLQYKERAEQRIGEQLFGVVNDVATLAVQFVREDENTGAIVPIDMTGALALRASLVKERALGATVYVQQTVFNEGVLPDNEDLAQGRVTWLLPIVSAPLETDLGTDPFIDIFLELTWLDSNDIPQTLVNMPFQVRAEGDTGAPGSPPASFPDNMLASTALATFVLLSNYLVPETIDVGDSPYTPTAIKGLKVILVDTTGGDVTFNLPESSATDDEYTLWIFNIGSNIVNVVPDASGTPDTVNDISGTQQIVSQFASLLIANDSANNNWLSPNFVIPS